MTVSLTAGGLVVGSIVLFSSQFRRIDRGSGATGLQSAVGTTVSGHDSMTFWPATSLNFQNSNEVTL